MEMAPIRIGICGLGFMGKMHFNTFAGLRGAEVTAISSSDPKKRKGDWSNIAGNIAGGTGMPDLSNVTMYEKFEDVVWDRNVDVVDITLPTILHAPVALKALKSIASNTAVDCHEVNAVFCLLSNGFKNMAGKKPCRKSPRNLIFPPMPGLHLPHEITISLYLAPLAGADRPDTTAIALNVVAHEAAAEAHAPRAA